MELEAIAQLTAIILGALGVIWHHQHTIDKLRAEVASLGQRLARIEGFLKIGMPAEATAEPEPAAVDPPT